MPKGPRPEPPFAELVERTEGLQPWRRVLHVVGGSCVAWVVYTLSPLSASTRWLFGGTLAMTFLVDVLRLRSEPMNRLFFRTFSALVCPREAEKLSLTWFLLGVFLVLWFPGGTLAVPSILVLAFADPAASAVGRVWGRHPLGKGTLEGTAAFFVAAVAVLIPFVGVWASLVVAALVATIEVFPAGLDDNVLIPVTAAAGLWALSGLT